MDTKTHAEGQPPRRKLTDAEGQVWEVRETTLSHEQPANKVLVFEASYVIRMVRNFPPDWASKSDAELMEVSQRVW